MLRELRIENFAILEKLHLGCIEGLTVVTGETGAGKSMLIDAVEMLLGGRADPQFVRAGAPYALVEGEFQLSPAKGAALRETLEREGLLDDPDAIILGREIRKEGRSVARVNGRCVSVQLLRALGEELVDVHGQSEHLSLLRVREHRGLLDRYANAPSALSAYENAYERWLKTRRELDALRHSAGESARLCDVLSFQAQEIESAQLSPDEEETCRLERDRLANVQQLTSLTEEAVECLEERSSDAPAACELLGKARRALANLAELDPSQGRLVECAEDLCQRVSELIVELRDYESSIESNPRRLEELDERLELIRSLKRKYGPTIVDVLAFGSLARKKLSSIEGADERVAELEKEEAGLKLTLAQLARTLTKKRQAAADKLARAVEKELADLQMAGARFAVDFQWADDPEGLPIGGRSLAFHAHGVDAIEFLIAPNPGEGLRPLAKTASGGETARLMLALKNVLSAADPTPTLIFDEIDQGIGGRVGGLVGAKLARLARTHQVLCITHLPQVAAFGAQHLVVQKNVQRKRTVARVDIVDGDARLDELAQMLGAVTEGTLRSARDLLHRASRSA